MNVLLLVKIKKKRKKYFVYVTQQTLQDLKATIKHVVVYNKPFHIKIVLCVLSRHVFIS